MRASREDSPDAATIRRAAVEREADYASNSNSLSSERIKGGFGSGLSAARNLNLFMFGSLYFAQGAMVAYFNNFQKPYLNSLGIHANVIGLLSSLLLVPFILKVVIGLVSDRVNLFGLGYRKPYILLGLLLSIVMMGMASMVRPDLYLSLFGVLLFSAALGMALFDTAADGLAIDITEPKSQGTVQASMVAGRAVGLIVISWFCGALAERQNYSSILLVIALCLLIPLVRIIRFREPNKGTLKKDFQWGALKQLLTPRVLLFCAYIFAAMLIMWGGINGLVTYYISRDLGATPSQVGNYGALVGVGSVAGAFAAGLALDRWDERLPAYLAVLGVTIIAVLLGLTTQMSLIYPLGVVWGVVFGFQQTVLVALAMRLTDVRVPASMFTIMMTIANIGLTVGDGLTTSLTDNLGFIKIFQILAAANLLLIPLIWLLFKMMRRSEASAA